jgi:hypothetical protein
MVTEGIQSCPFSVKPIPCSSQDCRNCDVLADNIDFVKARMDVAADIEDYWRHLNSGAEASWN